MKIVEGIEKVLTKSREFAAWWQSSDWATIGEASGIALGKAILTGVKLALVDLPSAIVSALSGVDWSDVGSGLKSMWQGWLKTMLVDLPKSMAAALQEFDWAGLGTTLATTFMSGLKSALAGLFSQADAPNPMKEQADKLRAQAAAMDARIKELKDKASVDGSLNIDTSGLERLRDRLLAQIGEIEAKLSALGQTSATPTVNTTGIDSAVTSAQSAQNALERIGSANATPTVNTTGIERAQTSAQGAVNALGDVGKINVTPTVNSTSIDRALTAAQRLRQTLENIPGQRATPGAAPPVAGARAGGGPVASGKFYLVGERGPEIFTPGKSGGITSNADARAASADGSQGAPASAAPAPVSKGQTVNFSPTVIVNAGAGADVRDLERRIRSVMRDEVRSLFRGAYSDTGLRTA